MSKETKKVIKVLVVIMVGILLCGIAFIKKNTDIDNGYVGKQKVHAVKFFNYLIVYDEEGNRRHYSNVRGFGFIEDKLILNVEESEDKGRTKIISREEKPFGLNGEKKAIAIFDFSKLTVISITGKKIKHYSGVKEIAVDNCNRLVILYYDGTMDCLE